MNKNPLQGSHINKNSILKDFLLMVLFLIVGISGRTLLVGLGLQPFPNFEIIMVVTFLAAVFIRPTFAFIVPLGSMMISDILLGNTVFIGNPLNKIVLFTYSGFLLIALLSYLGKKQWYTGLQQMRLKNIGCALGLAVGFTLLYDVWTNIGYWYIMTSISGQSLGMVLVNGIPFMIYHMLSGMILFLFVVLPVVSSHHLTTVTTIKKQIPTRQKILFTSITIIFMLLCFI